MTTADARRLIGRLGGVDAKVFQQFFTTDIDEDNRGDCSTYGDEQNGRFGATPSLGSLAVADRRDKSTRADRKETIARQVGVSPRTLSRWYAAEAFPERKRRTGETSCLEPYLPLLHQQWDAGCRNATHVWRTLRTEGFPGSYAVVYQYMTTLRRGQPVRSSEPARPAASSRTPHPPSLTARQLAYLFVRRPEKRTADAQEQMRQIRQHDPTIAQIAMLTETFAQMVRQRTPSALQTWLDTVLTSRLPDLKRFARGLQQDAAVHAALELPYSNGQTEGQVTRLKLLKRQMYGRAKLDLLRQRVLHAA